MGGVLTKHQGRERSDWLASLARLGRDRRGQSAVETMLAAPVLALILLALAQLFIISDVALDTLTQAHASATSQTHAKDWSKEFAIWEVSQTGTIEALPGMADLLAGFFKSRTGATASQYALERKLYLAGGSFAGNDLSGFGSWGDEDGYSQSGVRPNALEPYFK